MGTVYSMAFSKSEKSPRIYADFRELFKNSCKFAKISGQNGYPGRLWGPMSITARDIDNTIRNEYTGNHYERFGDSEPRTKYGQVSLPSRLLRGMLPHQLEIPHKTDPP